jgi:hypothetical protein
MSAVTRITALTPVMLAVTRANRHLRAVPRLSAIT